MEQDELTLPPLPDNFSLILFGLECATTRIVLEGLVRAGVGVKLVCLPGPKSIPLLKTTQRRTLRMLGDAGGKGPPTVSSFADSSGIELWRVGDLDAGEAQTALSAIDADLLLVACYNRLIPASLYAERRYGGINLHPSLLPDKRGPDPLFWVFRRDDMAVGTTVHRLTQRFDAGEILGQTSVPKPDGISESELDAQLAALGSHLLLQVLQGLTSDTLTPHAQDERGVTNAPHPNVNDYQLTLDLSARHAFNFFRGVAERGHPITLMLNSRRRQVAKVHRWTAGTECPSGVLEGEVSIRFSDGWLVLTLADSVHS